MASTRQERVEGRTEPALGSPTGPEEASDKRSRRRRRDEHHERRKHNGERDLDRRHYEGRHREHRRNDEKDALREEEDTSSRRLDTHDSRHSHRRHHRHREHGERGEEQERSHPRKDHRRQQQHRTRSKERAKESSRERSDRHRRRHDRGRDKRHDHSSTQLVLFQTEEPSQKSSQRDTSNVQDIHRDPKRDSDDALFALDTRGDPLIWQYGATDSRRVPTYNRYRHGCFVLGTPQRFTFSHEGVKTSFSLELERESLGSVFREKSNFALLKTLYGPAATTKSRISSGVAASEIGRSAGSADDFVSLRSSKKRKRGSISGGSGRDSGSDGFGDGTNSDSSDSSSSSEESSGDEQDAEVDNMFVVGDEARENLKVKLAELSRHVKEEPQDVDAWLELVDLQDKQILLLGNDDIVQDSAGKRTQSQDEIKGISALKLSMLESALRQVHPPTGRERIQLAIMREGSKVWTPKQLTERWAGLAQNSSSSSSSIGLSFALWRARLDFEMTNLSTVTVNSVKTFIVDRLRVLEGEAVKSREDDAKQADLYSQIIYIFLRATRFLYDAGFRDLATAAWQATLESAFARPPAEVEGASLGQFWDSEIQRIGEDGAQGWRIYAAKIKNGEDAEEALLEYNVQNQTLPTLDLLKIAARASGEQFYDMDEYKPLYEAWAIAERQRGDLAKLPARVIDDMNDDGYEDVFRVVVFSDMEQLLFTIPEAVLPVLKPLLVDAFLLFCQLPPAFATSSWIEIARNDPFLAIVVLSGATSTAGELSSGDDCELPPTGRGPPDLFYDGSSISNTPDVLFSAPGWFRYLPDWLSSSTVAASALETGEAAPVPPQWVANTLRQVVRSFGFGDLASYSLAVDAAVNPAGVKKAARTLLKQYISNTSLYEAYSLAEASQGKIDVARAVLASATAASNMDVEAELPLRHTWAWIELEAGQKDEAACRLLLQSLQGEAAADVPSQDNKGDAKTIHAMLPAQLLRLRHALQTGMDYSVSAGFVNRAVLFAQSFILLEYLSSSAHANEQKQLPQRHQSRQGNLSAALAAAALFSKEMKARGHGRAPGHERFLQGTVARLIYFHARHGPYRPAYLQEPLREMVTLFPRNGIFLRLFAWIDPASASGLSRLRPDDPLQQILDNVVLTQGGNGNDCPSSRAFAIRHALQSGHGQGHAARAAYERSLGGGDGAYNPACLGSARLWRGFVHLSAAEAMATVVTRAERSTSKRSRVRVDKKMAALAKDVYYRAVRACPASKDVLLEAFGHGAGLITLPSEAYMSPSDLRAIFQTVVSKGLRVHIDLNEVLDRARPLAKDPRR